MAKIKSGKIKVINKQLRVLVFSFLGRTVYEIARKRLACSETNIKRLLTKEGVGVAKNFWNLSVTLFAFEKYKNQKLTFKNIIEYNKVIGSAPKTQIFISDDEIKESVAHIVLKDTEGNLQNICILNLQEQGLKETWKPDNFVLGLYRSMNINYLITYSHASNIPPKLHTINNEQIKNRNAQKIVDQFCSEDILEALKIKIEQYEIERY